MSASHSGIRHIFQQFPQIPFYGSSALFWKVLDVAREMFAVHCNLVPQESVRSGLNPSLGRQAEGLGV